MHLIYALTRTLIFQLEGEDARLGPRRPSASAYRFRAAVSRQLPAADRNSMVAGRLAAAARSNACGKSSRLSIGDKPDRPILAAERRRWACTCAGHANHRVCSIQTQCRNENLTAAPFVGPQRDQPIHRSGRIEVMDIHVPVVNQIRTY